MPNFFFFAFPDVNYVKRLCLMRHIEFNILNSLTVTLAINKI